MSPPKLQRWTPLLGLGLGLALSTTIGCAAQHEEGMPNDVDRAADFEAEQPAEAAAMEPGAALSQTERNLDQMQRELAANEAKLRALGVSLPGPDENRRAAEDEAEDRDQGAGAGTTTPPADAKPGTQPAPSGGDVSGIGDKGKGKGKDAKQKKPSKREHESRTIEPHAAPDMADTPSQPEQAKAAPLSPNTQTREQDAAGRCLMICDLSQITCELNTQICELADRHDDQDDYRAACDHAAEDCELAQEACDACVG